MSEQYATLKLWQASTVVNNTFSQKVRGFENSAQIKLDYCVPLNWVKKRTETTGVQNEQDVHPDTGPAGAFVDIQITIDRSQSAAPSDFLTNLITWYGTQNTDNIFKRGFLGLENSDNPELDALPVEFLGYKLVQFGVISPVDFPGRQKYKILLQLGGKAIDLPTRE